MTDSARIQCDSEFYVLGCRTLAGFKGAGFDFGRDRQQISPTQTKPAPFTEGVKGAAPAARSHMKNRSTHELGKQIQDFLVALERRNQVGACDSRRARVSRPIQQRAGKGEAVFARGAPGSL
jgi:hypothetical protein